MEIYKAVKNHDYNTFRALISTTDINNLDENGNNLLHNMAGWGYPELLLLFLDQRKDISINSQNNQGETPLFIAVKNDRTENINILLTNGADINLGNNNDWSPLIKATEMQNIGLIETLVIGDCDLNHRDNNGSTALFHACELDSVDIVEYLVDSGADTSIINNNGKTVIDSARLVGNPQIIYNLSKGNPIIKKFVELSEYTISYRHNEKKWKENQGLSTSHGCYNKKDISGVLCDPIDQEDYEINQYLENDPGNIVFMTERFADSYNAIGYNVNSIVRDVDSDLYFDCLRDKDNNYLLNKYGDGRLVDPENKYHLTLDAPIYAKLDLEEYKVYIPLEDLVGSLGSGNRVFLLENSGITLKYTVSYKIAKAVYERAYYDLVSSDHCQKGTDKTIFNIYTCIGGDCLK